MNKKIDWLEVGAGIVLVLMFGFLLYCSYKYSVKTDIMARTAVFNYNQQ